MSTTKSKTANQKLSRKHQFFSRSFNQLKIIDDTVTKSSTDKLKVQAEYQFYHLLPDDFKKWFVPPTNFVETTASAAYSMPLLNGGDLASHWIKREVSLPTYDKFLAKFFAFLAQRPAKKVSADNYQQSHDQLYLDKVKSRCAQLKKWGQYKQTSKLLKSFGFSSLDNLCNRYFALKTKIESKTSLSPLLVIGHGDPCLANTFYDEISDSLVFIDPRGALSAAQLWIDPYYDIAKLAHSIIDNYDFIDRGAYSLVLQPDFSLDLLIDFNNSDYTKLFRQYLCANGYDYELVRLYEASLFLSMLPLHTDQHRDVLAFIIIAEKILQELETNNEL